MTATPTGSSTCAVPLDTGLVNAQVLCGSACASQDGSGNPTASGTGSLANASISLSLTSVLQQLLGGSIPSASSVCDNAPAATTTPGSNTSPLPGPVQSLVGTANRIVSPRLTLDPSSVASGSDLTGGCSVMGGLRSPLGAAGAASPATGAVTGILDQMLGLTGANASTIARHRGGR